MGGPVRAIDDTARLKVQHIQKVYQLINDLRWGVAPVKVAPPVTLCKSIDWHACRLRHECVVEDNNMVPIRGKAVTGGWGR